MVVRSLQKLLKLLFIAFAVLGFVAVPLFGKTGYEHLGAFLGSKGILPSGEFPSSFLQATERLRSEWNEQTTGQTPDDASPNSGRPFTD